MLIGEFSTIEPEGRTFFDLSRGLSSQGHSIPLPFGGTGILLSVADLAKARSRVPGGDLKTVMRKAGVLGFGYARSLAESR